MNKRDARIHYGTVNMTESAAPQAVPVSASGLTGHPEGDRPGGVTPAPAVAAPSIEDIVAGLLHGRITETQAVQWLNALARRVAELDEVARSSYKTSVTLADKLEAAEAALAKRQGIEPHIEDNQWIEVNGEPFLVPKEVEAALYAAESALAESKNSIKKSHELINDKIRERQSLMKQLAAALRDAERKLSDADIDHIVLQAMGRKTEQPERLRWAIRTALSAEKPK